MFHVGFHATVYQPIKGWTSCVRGRNLTTVAPLPETTLGGSAHVICPYHRPAWRPRSTIRGSPSRLSAGPCQGADVLRHLHPVRRSAKLTRAPHASRPSTPVTVRFSDSTGMPTIPDNDPAPSAPAGSPSASTWPNMSTRTSSPIPPTAFPVRTGEEFLEFLHAVAASARQARGPGSLPRRPPEREASSSKRPSRSRRVSRGRLSSLSPRSSSPTPTA